MRIVVLNGSPKGEYSNTIHYVKYIMKHRADHEYTIVDIGRDIKKIEKEADRFDAIVRDMKAADGIVWSFPVYHYSAPSQLMRFIELISERGASGAFQDKYATTVTTSVHFYDHLAHNYLHAVSEDLGMKYVEGFSAEMADLQKPEWRRQLLLFFDHFADSAREKVPVERRFAAISGRIDEYRPSGVKASTAIGDKKILLITDARASDVNLRRMIDVFRSSLDGPIDVINLHDIDMAGGCLGCMRCSHDNVCVYKDGLRSVYYDKMAGADAVVFAGSVHGRGLSSRWKMFWDRSFVNGHCAIKTGGQYGFLISGPLRQLPDMREELEARAQTSGNNMAGIVTDEYDDPAQITALIGQLVSDMAEGIESGYRLPPTYLAIGGRLIFRDLIYRIGGIFRADDRYYRKHGLYDYPYKDYKGRMLNFALKIIMGLGKSRKMIYAKAFEVNSKGYQKIIDSS